jgi:hypothetical protein
LHSSGWAGSSSFEDEVARTGSRLSIRSERTDPAVWGTLERPPYARVVSRFVLIHSPLVGVSTWSWAADELRAGGDEVVVPTISLESLLDGWSAVVSEVASQVSDTTGVVFVAHSGAGPLLPSIVEQAGAIDPVLIFVDAGIPLVAGETSLMPAELLKELTSLSRDGELPPWSEWFGPDAMAALIPDATKRRIVTSELPRLPIRYFIGSVPAVRPWPAAMNGYVLLSEAYVDDAKEARRRGWNVVELMGQHLDIVAKPRAVVEAIHQCRATG